MTDTDQQPPKPEPAGSPAVTGSGASPWNGVAFVLILPIVLITGAFWGMLVLTQGAWWSACNRKPGQWVFLKPHTGALCDGDEPPQTLKSKQP